jgi:hypothetical protein
LHAIRTGPLVLPRCPGQEHIVRVTAAALWQKLLLRASLLQLHACRMQSTITPLCPLGAACPPYFTVLCACVLKCMLHVCFIQCMSWVSPDHLCVWVFVPAAAMSCSQQHTGSSAACHGMGGMLPLGGCSGYPPTWCIPRGRAPDAWHRMALESNHIVSAFCPDTSIRACQQAMHNGCPPHIYQLLITGGLVAPSH